MAVWNREYQGIGITAEDRIVRILNDDALCERLKENGRAEAYQIALDVKEYYQKLFGGEVSISAKSLACEIYWHYLIKVKSEAIEKRWGKKKLTSWLLKHMEIIDCGDFKADNNRWLSDLLAIIFPVNKKSVQRIKEEAESLVLSKTEMNETQGKH